MDVIFEIGNYVAETEKLYKKIIKIYEQYDLVEDIAILKTNYKDIKREEKISLAFVGQYSAGKSTIIKALTGNNSILIDSDIATSEVKPYNWGNVVIIDTPGLNTNEHKEHDDLTMEAIKKADLLIYCITSDLFREVTRDDFKKLAKLYKAKLFLVINKMNKESGEYEELVENYKDSINKTLAPEYSLADFHNFFFDAADYIEGIDDDDDECIEDSHFGDFIISLNKFIELKGLIGKMLTPLTILQESVENASIAIEDDEHIKEGKQLLQKICKAIDHKKRSYVKVCANEIQKISNKYVQKGYEISMQLGNKDFSFNDKDFQDFSEPLQEKLCNIVTDYFEKYAQEVDNEVQNVVDSEQARHFFTEEKKRLEENIKGKNNSSEIFSTIEDGIGKVTVNAAPRISSVFARIANVQDGKEVTIWTVRGSDLHNIVKDVGHKLGYKFKPFEALKISKKIANLSRWLGPVLTGAGTVVELLGVIAEKRADKKLGQEKDNVKLVFKGMAEETEEHYSNQVNEAAKEFDKIKEILLEELGKIEETSENNKVLKKELADIKAEIVKLQHKIEYRE